LLLVTGAISGFEALLITVAVVFDRSPNLVVRTIGAFVVFFILVIAGRAIRNVSETGGITV
jgi:hypothetical protein